MFSGRVLLNDLHYKQSNQGNIRKDIDIYVTVDNTWTLKCHYAALCAFGRHSTPTY